MINLGNYSVNCDGKPIQEGTIGDLVKDSVMNNTEEIRDAWNKAKENENIIGGANQVLGAVKNTADSAKTSTDKVDGFLNKHTVNTSSIIARARNSVCQFPIYVPQTIRVNESHTIGKLFERVYATLVQAVLAQNPIMNEEEANNLVFLKKFHTNIKEAADVLVNEFYEPIDELDRMMTESIFYEQQITEKCKVQFRVVPTVDQYLINENARLINEPLAGIAYLREAPVIQTNETTTTKAKGTIISEKDLIDIAKNRASLTEEEKRYLDKSSNDIVTEVNNGTKNKDKIPQITSTRLKIKKDAEDKVNQELINLKNDIKAGKVSNIKYIDGQYRRTDVEKTSQIASLGAKDGDRINSIDAPKFLKDSDIKKQNGLLPYTIEATFLIKTNGGIPREVRYIIGIKTVMHLFRTQDLAEDLKELIMGNVKSIQKVRYKTGEIKFKDYFLNIKGLKSDASKHINYNKRWLNTLKRLATYRDMNGAVMKGQLKSITDGEIPIPNGTLVLSQPDVVNIANQTGIDLSIVSNSKRLARSLFLISVVIVDSSAGTMRVLFPDMDNEWDIQSLASIDAELAKTDNSQLMKELNRMVNK